MIKKLVVFAFAFLMMFSFACAKISISTPDELYNLGDKLYVTVTIIPSVVSGNFEIVLNCANQSAVIYKVPSEASFSLNKEQMISTYISLTNEYIGNLSGNCYLISSMRTCPSSQRSRHRGAPSKRRGRWSGPRSGRRLTCAASVASRSRPRAGRPRSSSKSTEVKRRALERHLTAHGCARIPGRKGPH